MNCAVSQHVFYLSPYTIYHLHLYITSTVLSMLVLLRFCYMFTTYFLFISLFSNVCTLYLSLDFSISFLTSLIVLNGTLRKVGSDWYLYQLLYKFSASECSCYAFYLLICDLFDCTSSHEETFYVCLCIYFRGKYVLLIMRSFKQTKFTSLMPFPWLMCCKLSGLILI